MANNLHPNKLSRTTTWQLPNGQVCKQIDFILVPLQRFKSRVNQAKTRTFPGADIGSDHNIVMTTFKLKLKTKHCRKSPCTLFDLGKLKDPKDGEIFQAQVGGKFASLNMLVTLTFDIN